ncbi:MAG: A/G-specific adenine glycosylase [Minisyncoccia bacterium]
MKKLSSLQVKSFRDKVWDFYSTQGRHGLPWRPPQLKIKNRKMDMYPIIVSEIMLQQTQVSRVLPKFESWMKQFPDVKTLAQASRKDVLTLWQGLGYTRRAKFLHEAAQRILKNGVPSRVQELEDLPGIGHYTARAITTFAWNQSHAFVETNIRTVYINHFFKNKESVADRDILSLVEQTLDINKPREWMYALMDYGSYLKSQGKSHNGRAKSFTRQSKFKGSVREVRGAIMKYFTGKEVLTLRNQKEFEKRFDTDRVTQAVNGLVKDGLIKKQKDGYEVVE